MSFEVGILLIAGAVGAVALILKMVKSAVAGKNSEIEIKDDHIRGKGCVGAIGQDALDLNSNTSIGSFHNFLSLIRAAPSGAACPYANLAAGQQTKNLLPCYFDFVIICSVKTAS